MTDVTQEELARRDRRISILHGETPLPVTWEELRDDSDWSSYDVTHRVRICLGMKGTKIPAETGGTFVADGHEVIILSKAEKRGLLRMFFVVNGRRVPTGRIKQHLNGRLGKRGDP